MRQLSRRMAAIGLIFAPAACATAPAQPAAEAPALDPRLSLLSRFVGQWRGVAEGEPGTGAVDRTYAPTLGGKFIEERNESRYASGEIHHHVGYWSFDRGRGRVVLRHFHVEGFVNTFVATTGDFAGGTLVLETESIENIPAGFRARETYRFESAYAFEEVFEIAEPGGDFQLYSRNRFQRAASGQ